MNKWDFAKIANENYTKTRDKAVQDEKDRKRKENTTFWLKVLIIVVIAIIQTFLSYLIRRGF